MLAVLRLTHSKNKWLCSGICNTYIFSFCNCLVNNDGVKGQWIQIIGCCVVVIVMNIVFLSNIANSIFYIM